MNTVWTLPGDGKLRAIEQDDQTAVMYAVTLKSPSAIHRGAKPEYDTTGHVFTENEINRASIRFFAETGETARRKLALGYVGVTTFNNTQGVLVTRYIVNLKTDNGVVTALFSTREYLRSIKRYKTICPERPSLKSMICRLFKK